MELPKSFSVSGRIPLMRYSLTQRRKKKTTKLAPHPTQPSSQRGGSSTEPGFTHPPPLPTPQRTLRHPPLPFPGSSPRENAAAGRGTGRGAGPSPPLGSRPSGLSVPIPSRPPPNLPGCAGVLGAARSASPRLGWGGKERFEGGGRLLPVLSSSSSPSSPLP